MTDKTLTIRIPLDIYNELSEVANTHYRGNKSFLILDAVEDFLKYKRLKATIEERVNLLEKQQEVFDRSLDQVSDVVKTLHSLIDRVLESDHQKELASLKSGK